MNSWLVKLFRVDEDGSRHFINADVFWADTEKDAGECAIDSWWDPRLEAAGCSPAFEVTPAELRDPPEDVCPLCHATSDQCQCDILDFTDGVVRSSTR